LVGIVEEGCALRTRSSRVASSTQDDPGDCEDQHDRGCGGEPVSGSSTSERIERIEVEMLKGEGRWSLSKGPATFQRSSRQGVARRAVSRTGARLQSQRPVRLALFGAVALSEA